ncbi:MAG: potassium channel family protein [Acidimicrobiia bacterium]
MRVIVVGCGRVGSELAGRLEAAGHEVAIVDKRADAFRRLPPGFKGKKVVGFGFDRDHLAEAGIEGADAVAAVTSGDNSNILSARIARETYGVAQVVARIYDPRRAMIYQRLGIATVATVAWTVDQVLARLFAADQAAVWTDESSSLHVIGRGITPGWTGKKLGGLDEPGQFRLVGISRFGESMVPADGVVGQEGDQLWFSVATGAVEALDQRLTHGEVH